MEIKSIEEFNKKASELEYLSCNCGYKRTYEEQILFEKLLEEVTEYDDYLCINTPYEEGNQVIIKVQNSSITNTATA